MKTMIGKWRARAKKLQIETYALYLAYRDPRVPWYAKAFAAFVVGYAFSPIDLIPDFIPILGYLDDLLLIPAGIGLALRMIPIEVMEEARKRASEQLDSGMPTGRFAMIVIVCIWLTLAFLGIAVFMRLVLNR